MDSRRGSVVRQIGFLIGVAAARAVMLVAWLVALAVVVVVMACVVLAISMLVLGGLGL